MDRKRSGEEENNSENGKQSKKAKDDKKDGTKQEEAEEKEKNFKSAKFYRIALCEALFFFVTKFAQNENHDDYKELCVNRGKETTLNYVLPPSTAELFGHLLIAAMRSKTKKSNCHHFACYNTATS